MEKRNLDRRKKKTGSRDLSTRYQKTERLTPEEKEKLQAELAAKRAKREAAATRISYIKKPFASRSYYSVGIGAAALLIGIWGFYGGVATVGQAPLSSGALGLCSIVAAVIALWYGLISFLEKEKNYLLARIGLGLGGVTLIFWIVIIIIGFGG